MPRACAFAAVFLGLPRTDGCSRNLTDDRREIAIFRTASDEVFALENRCSSK